MLQLHDCMGQHQFREGVVVVGGLGQHAVQPLAAGQGARDVGKAPLAMAAGKSGALDLGQQRPGLPAPAWARRSIWPPGGEADLVVQVAHGAKHVLGVLMARKRSCMKGVWMASVIMPSRWMFCCVSTLTTLNSASCTWPLEDVAGHVLGRRHVLQRQASGKT
jgi:hypothetical protein